MNDFTRDNNFYEYDSRSPSSRASERHELDEMVNAFLRKGGSIEIVTQPTMAEIKRKFNNAAGSEEKARENAQKYRNHSLLNLEAAQDAGRETFIGFACKKCGGTDRYVKGRHACVVCFPRTEMPARTKAMYARKEARQADEKSYIGQPCAVCGCTERNTDTGACIKYYSHSAIRRAERQKFKLERAEAAI